MPSRKPVGTKTALVLVQKVAGHVQRLLGCRQHLHFEVLVVVGFGSMFFTVMTMPIVVVLFLLVIGMLSKVNLTPHLLQVKVSIHVVLQAQNTFLAFVRPQNDIAACGPIGPFQETKSAILIKPKSTLTALFATPSSG